MSQYQKVRRISALSLILGGALVCVVVMIRALWYDPQFEVPAPAKEAEAPIQQVQVPDQPLQLRIPALSIDAVIQYVGVKANGAMAAPNNFTDVGWYKYGTVPGGVGSAVIAGHVDNGLAFPGVFKRLSQIKKGDDIYIDTKGGGSLHFVVDEVAVYPYQNVPLERLFNAYDAARLNLITCTGAWVPTGRTYDQRIVVYAILQTQQKSLHA